MDKFLIVDGSSLVFRAFYALPLLKSTKGTYTNAVYGFLNMFLKLVEEEKPKYAAVLFDRKAPTFRHEVYNEYKGTRKPTPSELAVQFPVLMEILENLGIVCMAMDGYEADDLAGTLSRIGEEAGLDVLLVSGDRDYLQLAGKRTIVRLTKKGISQTSDYNEAAIFKEYGIKPEQLIDLKGLMGDVSDNIPGVKGIGEKTGLKLIGEYGTLENLYGNLENISGKKLKENLSDGMQLAFLSRKLATITRYVPIDENIEAYRPREKNLPFLKRKFDELEFRSLERYVSEAPSLKLSNYDYEIISTDAIKSKLLKSGEYSFVLFTDTGDYRCEKVFSAAFATEESKAMLLFLGENEVLSDYRELFENDIRKITHNKKEAEFLLRSAGIEAREITGDTEILGYLLDPSRVSYTLDKLCELYLGEKGISSEEVQGKGAKLISLSKVSKEKLSAYMAFSALAVIRLHSVMKRELPPCEVKLYDEMEIPLASVLCDLELTGFKLDGKKLEELKRSFLGEIERLTEEIYDYAGGSFNINSTKQLGEILFDKLKLPVIKKTKTGYSTDASVLGALYDEHPIVEKLLRYRQVQKLQSTYVEALLSQLDSSSRIHSQFNQTVVQTGRISSQNPNLQNILVKSEDGKKIREAFIAEEGSVLLDLDYSQIELRILAAMSKDENLIEAFEKGIDIHQKTASEVMHIPLESVTPSQRSKAKAVNFGIIYGISDFGLASQLKIPRKEAKEYIENYLNKFPKIKLFLESCKENARKDGYVETLFKRRRYIPEITAKNFNIRSFGERIAMNTPIQGTAADIIKLAMVKIAKELKIRKMKSRLILQVHDELVLECPEEEAEEAGKMAKYIMENAAKLLVELLVDMGIGKNWYEAK